jgi:signal recognition particle protein
MQYHHNHDLHHHHRYTEVENVMGMKLDMEGDTPRASYLVQWKKDSSSSSSEGNTVNDMTWEPASNLSEDVVREYENKWWSAARKVSE